MNALALRRQLPLIKLSATAMGILLLAGTVFLLIRYFRLTAHGESLSTAFETGRMLVNFGGMALLSPIVYWVGMFAIKRPGFRVLFYIAGLFGFAMAYLLLNKLILSLMGQGQVSMDFWKGSKKLFLNFGHILMLSYAAMLYGSHDPDTAKSNDRTEHSRQKRLKRNHCQNRWLEPCNSIGLHKSYTRQ